MTTLTGLRVLIVEDEALIAMMAEDLVESAGCIVVGNPATVAESLAAVATLSFDVVMLDVNLNGESSMSVATALKACKKPFVFTTGYGVGGIEPEHRDMPVLTKPYAAAELETALRNCAGARQEAGTSSTTSITDSNFG